MVRRSGFNTLLTAGEVTRSLEAGYLCMMKVTIQFLFVGLLILGGRYIVLAQETADPAARKVLNQVKAHYDKPGALQLELQLTVTPAEQKPEVQKGRLISQGDKYHLELGPQAWYCDGKTVWIHLKDQKEVQIHNARDESGNTNFLTPRDILKRYDSGDYIYALLGTGVENKRPVRYIEFKPKDRNDEFFKLRLSVDAKSPEIVKFEAFSRDGSRYVLDILQARSDVKPSPDLFVFKPAAHPGVAVEDLRLN
jgi:outer membrane lipoprotein carrier protein